MKESVKNSGRRLGFREPGTSLLTSAATGRLFGLIVAFLMMAKVWGAESTRFLAVDVFVDAKGAALSAYQLEVRFGKESKVVGVEGGEGEFAKAPFYDPKAMQRERIVVAAFSVAEERKLPKGRTRVLSLHVQTGSALFAPDVRKFLATDSNGKKIDATIRVVERRE